MASPHYAPSQSDGRTRRVGVYFTPSSASSKIEVPATIGYRQGDVTRRSGETDAPRGKSNGRPTDFSIRNNGRSPSPVHFPGPKGRSGPGFGFHRPTAIPSATTGTPTLRNKHSRSDLRRKPHAATQNTALAPTPSKMDTSLGQVKRTPKRSVPEKAPDDRNRNENHAPVIPELDRYRSVRDPAGHVRNTSATDAPHKLASPEPPPPTPFSSGVNGQNRYSSYSGNSGNSGYSASPSTRYSESPGPGAYSRDTTPTSMSSQSPGLVAPVRMAPRLRQNSPITSRPLLGRRRTGSTSNDVDSGIAGPQGLPPVRESSTSSSNSTVRGNEGGGRSPNDKKKKKNRLSPLPPSPPPRKSSQNFKKSQSQDATSPAKSIRTPPRHPVGTATDESPLRIRSPENPPFPPKGIAPRRPSRDGTPDLEEQLEASTRIIHSNLTGFHFSKDKRKSGSTPHTTEKYPLHETAPVLSGLGIVPDLGPDSNGVQQRHPTLRTPSPGTATSKRRFGIFGRRTKTTPEPSLEPKEKSTRRGPAAGTGHEGYGRYAFGGRGGSVLGRERSNSTTSSSQESTNSNRTHDPFLLERMSPVVIAGGGEIVENHNASLDLSRNSSHQSLNPNFDLKLSSPETPVSRNNAGRAALWPSAMPREHIANGSSTSVVSKGSYLSSSSGNSFLKKPALAFRRSIQRFQLDDEDPLNVPSPDETVTSVLDTDPTPGFGANQRITSPKMPRPKKLSKRPPSPRKRNLLPRPQASAKSNDRPDAILPVVIASAQAPSKPLPFYAMIDSSEQVGSEAVNFEDIFGISKTTNPSGSSGRRVDSHKQLEEALIPSLGMSHAQDRSPENQENDGESAKPVNVDQPVLDCTPAENFPPQNEYGVLPSSHSNDPTTVRRSRLPHVGRIPRVVTARPYLVSPKSFSRPFARISVSQPLPNISVVDQESIALGPSPGTSPNLLQASEQAPEPPEEPPMLYSNGQPSEFLISSARKNSEATTTTSGSSGAVSYAGTTAIIPKPGTALGEDEIWGEYDDLIWDEPLEMPSMSLFSPYIPSKYEKLEGQQTMDLGNEHFETSLPAIFPPPMDGNGAIVPSRLWLTSSSVYSTDFSANIKNAFAGPPTPTSPSSFTDFFASYGERNIISEQVDPTHVSSSQSYRDSASTSAHSKHECTGGRRRPSTDSRAVDGTKHLRDSSSAQVNLRVGSMTVSRWLTFGRVLFSPVREEIESSKEAKNNFILVIDGLGNDDWSFYAAETYPSATFYNLSSTPSNTGASPTRTSSFPQVPINHRQVQYQNNLDKFPFPRDMFTVVVLRFPVICSDTAIRNLISESKRVLKPGGYLEISILDLDMMNMGHRTRRAIRDLKIKLTGTEPPVSLASASDTVLRLAGRRGFEDIKSCNVGVPVAGTIAGSNSPKSTPSEERDFSLVDMMNDESGAGDVGITKMVAKVGRWWFLRCYEMAVLPNGDTSKSIFKDTMLLKECEKWNTSFKLLVCYAQKPVIPCRRTVSV